MPKTRPPYPAEFRQQMLELVAAGRTPAQLSREFGCSAQTIANWIAAAGIRPVGATQAAAALSSAEREELARLRRENRRLQMERDILAKATAWFAAKGDKTFTPSTSS
jgi:transposase